MIAKWVFVACAAPAAFYFIGLGVGSRLPANLAATASIVINRPPENVWWILTDYSNEAMWHPQYKETSMTSGPGEWPIRWRVMYTDGQIANVEVTSNTFPHMAERILDKGLSFTGGWTVDLERAGDGCRVTAHSSVEIHPPLDRLFVRWFVHPEAELGKILDRLKQRVETTTGKPSPGTI